MKLLFRNVRKTVRLLSGLFVRPRLDVVRKNSLYVVGEFSGRRTASGNCPDGRQVDRQKRSNRTGFVGVKRIRRKGRVRFEAYIRGPDGGKVYCGAAATAGEAARLYDLKAIEFYGEDSKHLNFPASLAPRVRTRLDPAPATQDDPEREPPTDWAAVAIVAAGWLASALAIVAWALFKSGVLL